jgi:hypothetical protein
MSSESSEDFRHVAYRNYNLHLARIFINEMAEEYRPPYVRAFSDSLTYHEPDSALGEESSPSLVPHDSLRSTAAALADEAKRCRLQKKSRWVNFARRVFSVLDHPLLSRCQHRRFDGQASLVSGYPLYPSTPDLAFGLAIPDPQEPSLSLDSLIELNRLYGIQPFSLPAYPDLAFPCLIFEAEPDTGCSVAAENRAAHGAAKALAMVKTLADSYRRVGGAQSSPRLPVVVVCSVGSLYEVFVAFDLSAEELTISMSPHAALTVWPGIHLVGIWAGKVDYTEMMLQLQLLLHRLLRWILETWRPTIVGMLDTVRAAMVATAPETAQV